MAVDQDLAIYGAIVNLRLPLSVSISKADNYKSDGRLYLGGNDNITSLPSELLDSLSHHNLRLARGVAGRDVSTLYPKQLELGPEFPTSQRCRRS